MLILELLVTLFGAWFIKDVIKDFIAKHYFLFGLNIMLTVWSILELIKLVF